VSNVTSSSNGTEINCSTINNGNLTKMLIILTVKS
jgi:hypothetical protein